MTRLHYLFWFYCYSLSSRFGSLPESPDAAKLFSAVKKMALDCNNWKNRDKIFSGMDVALLHCVQTYR